jgi:hypothetical protein
MRAKSSPVKFGVAYLTILILVGFFLFGFFQTERIVGTSTQVAFAATERPTYKATQVLSNNGGNLPLNPSKDHSGESGFPIPACPPPTVAAGAQCVLTANATLTHTLILADNTILNCQSHTLVPLHQGKDLNVRSNPQVAIFLNAAENVQIKNCVMLGFDFGVFAINSKHPPGSAPIQILQNKIRARFVAISLMSVDDAEIKGNLLEWRTKGGRALYVGRDSDRNKILDNHISAHINNSFEAVRAPGPASGTLGANPPVSAGSAVLIAQTEGAEPMLLNALIDGRLLQLTVENSPTPDERFSEGNTFSGNTIRLFGSQPVDGVVVAIAQGTVISNNKIVGARNSIRIGIQTDLTKRFPGKCQLKAGRLCLENRDCSIPPIDPPVFDACTNLPPPTPVTWVSGGNSIQDNVIHGPFDAGIGTLGRDTKITGNNIIGPLRSVPVFPLTGPPVGGIVLVGKFGLGDTTIVSGNIVRDVAIALTLSHEVTVGPPQPTALATEFKAHITVNDFTGYSTAVLLMKGNTPPIFYRLLTELSDNSRGNYWGLMCPTCFDLSKVKNSDGSTYSPPPAIQDSFCFGVPVAKASPQPTPCR